MAVNDHRPSGGMRPGTRLRDGRGVAWYSPPWRPLSLWWPHHWSVELGSAGRCFRRLGEPASTGYAPPRWGKGSNPLTELPSAASSTSSVPPTPAARQRKERPTGGGCTHTPVSPRFRWGVDGGRGRLPARLADAFPEPPASIPPRR